MVRPLAIALVVLPLLLAACEPAPDREPGACVGDEDPRIDVGHDSDGALFVPIEEGETLELEPGPACVDCLVTLSMLLEGFVYPELPYEWPGDSELRRGEVELVLLDGQGRVAGFRGVRFEPEDLGDEPLLLDDLRLVVERNPDEVPETAVDLVVRAADACAGELSLSREVSLVW